MSVVSLVVPERPAAIFGDLLRLDRLVSHSKGSHRLGPVQLPLRTALEFQQLLHTGAMARHSDALLALVALLLRAHARAERLLAVHRRGGTGLACGDPDERIAVRALLRDETARRAPLLGRGQRRSERPLHRRLRPNPRLDLSRELVHDLLLALTPPEHGRRLTAAISRTHPRGAPSVVPRGPGSRSGAVLPLERGAHADVVPRSGRHAGYAVAVPTPRRSLQPPLARKQSLPLRLLLVRRARLGSGGVERALSLAVDDGGQRIVRLRLRLLGVLDARRLRAARDERAVPRVSRRRINVHERLAHGGGSHGGAARERATTAAMPCYVWRPSR